MRGLYCSHNQRINTQYMKKQHHWQLLLWLPAFSDVAVRRGATGRRHLRNPSLFYASIWENLRTHLMNTCHMLTVRRRAATRLITPADRPTKAASAHSVQLHKLTVGPLIRTRFNALKAKNCSAVKVKGQGALNFTVQIISLGMQSQRKMKEKRWNAKHALK